MIHKSLKNTKPLGIWISETESAKFWLTICNELKHRGVHDILIACLDGLKGLPDAIRAVSPWVNHWDLLATFFKFPDQIRRIMYTTNTVEALHRQFRKVTQSKAVFPSDHALLKMLYLAAQDIQKKWKTPAFAWRQVISPRDIFFPGRVSFL